MEPYLSDRRVRKSVWRPYDNNCTTLDRISLSHVSPVLNQVFQPISESKRRPNIG
jgi:hypothetical protein